MADSLHLIQGGPNFFHRLKALINGCQKELHFQTYRLEPDETGQSVSLALMNAANRGVAVYLLLDAYGSKNVPVVMLNDWKAAGIRVRFFSPFFTWKGLHLGRRLHHKVVVADERSAIIGGINVANEYRGTPQAEAWLDFAVGMEGELCKAASALCAGLWGKNLLSRRWFKSRQEPVLPKPAAQIRHNDWLLGKREIYRGYLREARGAKSHIILMAGYFLPGLRFRQALADAASRGVKVRLILSGISDVPAMQFATNWLYGFLLKNGIEIYEWHPSVLHGKAMLADGRWCTIGSFNLMSLSTYGSVETNVEITEREFVAGFERRLEELLKDCKAISKEDYRKKTGWSHQLRNWFYYHLMRSAFYMLVSRNALKL